MHRDNKMTETANQGVSESTVSAQAAKRNKSRLVATSLGCTPLKIAYSRAENLRPKTWGDVEDLFLRGLEGFDENIVSGTATMGDLQNGKGDFFNDLLALILENCAGVELYSRGAVPGLIFPKHHLDVTFPNQGAIEFILEAKAVGTPKHPGSPRQKPIGRPGSADLDKRVKEIGFKTIDLKAEYARILTSLGHSPTVMAGDLTTWLRSVKPKSYVFFAARVISDTDRDRLASIARVAGQISDAVGVFCFRPVSADEPTRYRAEAMPSDIAIDRVLFRACQDLTALKHQAPVIAPTRSPAEAADDIPV
jgi:hypothetical protein